MNREFGDSNYYFRVVELIDHITAIGLMSGRLNAAKREQSIVEARKIVKELGGIAAIEQWMTENHSGLVFPTDFEDISWLNENN